ncbi:hypothetical protein HD554DRAFT_1983098, partial [Boletus coccyginus]
SKKPLLDDKKRSVSLDSLVDNPDSEEDEFEVLRTKYVGDMDLPEREEPLLNEFRCRFILFPMQYHKVSASDPPKWERTFWTAEEMDLSRDLPNRNARLNDNEQHFVSHVVLFF